MEKKPPVRPLGMRLPSSSVYRSGDTINDRYRVERALGTGAMGQVYLVTDMQRDDRQLALKYLMKKQSPASLARFKTEFATLAHLRHPNITAVYDLEEDAHTGSHFFTTEFVVGEIFDRATASRSVTDTIDIFVQSLRALAYLHGNGLVHFDIKSANLLVHAAADGQAITKLIDFGVASPGWAGKRKGTPSYMAPEIVRAESADARADLYSLGVLMYFALTKSNPFRARDRAETYRRQTDMTPPPPSSKNLDVPEYVDRIIMRMLEKDPAARFQHAEEIIRELNRTGPTQFAIETDATRGSYIPDEGPFIARLQEKSWFQEQLQDPIPSEESSSPITWVYGAQGTGKSRLLRELRLMAQVADYKTHLFDLSQASERHRCLQTLETLSAASPERRWIGLDNMHGLIESAGNGALVAQVRAALSDALHRHTVSEDGIGRLVISCTSPDNSEIISPLCALLHCSPDAMLRLPIRNFSREELSQYLATCTGIAEPPARLVDECLQYTAGNPFFLTEMIKALIRGGQLLDARGRWKASTVEELGIDLSRVQIPRTIEAAIAHDFATMPEASQQVAALLAVLRTPCTLMELRHLLRHPVSHDALALLMRRGFIMHNTETQHYTFRSDAQAQAIYQQLGKGMREELHDRIAKRLQTLENCDLEQLAHHQSAGSDVTTAQSARWTLAHHLHTAHRSNESLYYLQSYITHYAITPNSAVLPSLPEVYWLLARCHQDTQDFDEAIATIELGLQCVTTSEADHEWHVRLLEIWGLTARDARDYRTAELKFAEALTLLGDDAAHQVRRIRIHNALAQAIMYQSSDSKSLERAIMIFQRTALQAAKLTPSDRREITNNDLGHALFQQGKYHDAIRVLQRDVEDFVHAERTRGESRARGLLGEAFRHTNQFVAAETEVLKAIELAKQSSDHAQLVHLYTNMGNIHSDQQQGEQAFPYYQRALDLSRRVGDPSSSMALLLNLGIIRREQKQYKQAADYFTSVITFAENGYLAEGLDERYRCRAELELAHLHHLQERYGTALTHIQAARAIAERSAACQSLMFWIVATTIEIHRDRGQPDQARNLIPLMSDLATSDLLTSTAQSLEASLVEETLEH